MTSYSISTLEGERLRPFFQAYKQFQWLVGQLNDPKSQKLNHGAVEALIHTQGIELLR